MAPISAIDRESSRDIGTASSVKLLRATAAIAAALHASWKTLLSRATCECSAGGGFVSPPMGTATHRTGVVVVLVRRPRTRLERHIGFEVLRGGESAGCCILQFNRCCSARSPWPET